MSVCRCLIVAWQSCLASLPKESHPLKLVHKNFSWLIVGFLRAFPLPLSGPVNSDVMPNGNGLAEGFDTAGDTLPLTAPPQSTSSPVNSQNREPSPGVAAYPPMMLEKSEGASAEVTVHKSDALQSLRLSMPMQETELCKHKFMCSECPLYNPFYSNLPFWCGVFWSLAHVQVFALTPLSVCYLDWRIQWGFHLAVWLYLLPETPIAVFCLTKILCGCFFFSFSFSRHYLNSRLCFATNRSDTLSFTWYF